MEVKRKLEIDWKYYVIQALIGLFSSEVFAGGVCLRSEVFLDWNSVHLKGTLQKEAKTRRESVRRLTYNF